MRPKRLPRFKVFDFQPAALFFHRELHPETGRSGFELKNKSVAKTQRIELPTKGDVRETGRSILG
jgi:hypothetical protein